MERILLGGGCFWCIEAVLQDLKGVEEVRSGYAGGHIAHPTYDQVCSGRTGHAEVVEVTFDPAVLVPSDLFRIFLTLHDPTTLNRQGGDVGTQYRSVIFYTEENQAKIAGQVIADMESEAVWPDPIITAIEPAPEFYPAEDYHQHYFKTNQNAGYCQIVIAPKISKLRKHFFDALRADAVK